MRLAQFVAQQAGGLGEIVNERRLSGLEFGGVMIDDQPVRLVQTRLKTQVADPRGGLSRFALSPGVVMIGFDRNIRAVQFFRQPL